MVYQKKKKNNSLRWILSFLGIVILGMTALHLTGIVHFGPERTSAVKLRCVSTQQVTPFGENVLYYDGTTLFCLNAGGGEVWSFTLGSGAGFSCEGGTLVAWVDNQLFIFDKNGRSTYNDHLPYEVQFAKAGSKYVAAVLGDGISPTLMVKDLRGLTLDEETTAYMDRMILDVGFFSDGEFLWATALDVYGTVPSTTMYIIQVGRMNTGEVSLGENLTYAVKYAGSKLNVITTRQLLMYDYRGVQDKSGTQLVYGWKLIDAEENGASAELLFAPSRQAGDRMEITELRLIRGSKDQRFTLPSVCVGAALRGDRIYAFGTDGIYRAGYRDSRFTTLGLNLGSAVTAYLGMTSKGVALVACGNDVYAVTLP